MKNLLFVLTAAFIAILSLNSCEETEKREGILIAKQEKNAWVMNINEEKLIQAIKKERKLKSLSDASIGIIKIEKETYLEIKGMIEGNSYHSTLKLTVEDNTAYLEKRAGNRAAGQSCSGNPCSKCKIITNHIDGGCSCNDGKTGSKCNHSVWTSLSKVFWGEFKLISF